MRKIFAFNKKAVLKSLIMVFILISVSIVTPVTMGSSVENLSIQKQPKYERLLYETEIVAKNFDRNLFYQNLRLIVSSLKDSSIEKNYFIEDLMNMIYDTLEYKPEHKENFFTNGDMAQSSFFQLKNLLSIKEEYNDFYQLLEKNVQNIELNNDISQDFQDYLTHYLILTAILYGNVTLNQEMRETPRKWWPLLVLGKFFHETNYYDWVKNTETKIEQARILSSIIGILCVVGISIGGMQYPGISVFFSAIILLTMWFNADMAAYVHNGHDAFQRLRDREVNIIIHLMDNGTNIPEYKLTQPIKAENVDALNWIDGEERPDIGKDENNFKYELGKSQSMNINGETGWFSLENRERPYEDLFSKYRKAPCPPGKWKIEMKSNEYYKGFTLDLTLIPGETLIIPVNLTRNQNIE